MRPFYYYSSLKSFEFNIRFIQSVFGQHVSATLKRWINTNYRLIKATSQVHFLKTCKLNNIVPTHLSHIYNIKFYSNHYKTTKKLERLLCNSQKKILQIEIFDLHRLIDSLHKELSCLSSRLTNSLPPHIWNGIQGFHYNSFKNFSLRLFQQHKKKYFWLSYNKNLNMTRKIKPIQYHCVQSNPENENNNIKYVLSTYQVNPEKLITQVYVDPTKYVNQITNPLNHTNNNWFINLTDTIIPPKVSVLLQLGGNFCLPTDNCKKMAIHEFIKHLESYNRYFNESERTKIRNTVIPFFHRFIHNKVSSNVTEKTLLLLKKLTTSFCKNNPNIIFTRADKGNITVALKKDTYISKMEELLNDKNTYEIVRKNPIVNTEKKLNSMIKKWFQLNFISKQSYFSMHSTDSTLPKAYGLPKIHKINYPFRIIVSSINTALYPLASFLHKIIQISLPPNHQHVKNSFELYGSLSGKLIQDTDTLISLDVISLFTNIPQDLAIDSIVKRWTSIEKNTNIPMEDFISAVKFVLTSTYFTFNNVIYRQTFGTPMGSPLSPVIAYIVMQDLEEKALEKINLNLPFYYRYVDDIIMAAPIEHILNIQKIFNSFHNRIQFTIELENNRKISFLDLSLEVVDNKIKIDWFHKKTFSGRFLSFLSNHPIYHKIGTIYNLVDRAFLLSHPDFHQKNIELCIKLLLDNGYPLDLIFEKINKRLKKLITTTNHNKIIVNHSTDTIDKDQKKFFIIPYIRNISEITATLINRSLFTVGYRCLNKIDNIIKVHKDHTEHIHKSNIVYKIHCNNCDASYVGQTKRQLKTRTKEHFNNIKLDKSRHSVITQHILEFNHSFNWNDIKILDSEPNYNRRLISEMLHIKEQTNGINLKKDTEFLDESYFNLLDTLSNNK